MAAMDIRHIITFRAENKGAGVMDYEKQGLRNMVSGMNKKTLREISS
jgi:hypothetical protein